MLRDMKTDTDEAKRDLPTLDHVTRARVRHRARCFGATVPMPRMLMFTPADGRPLDGGMVTRAFQWRGLTRMRYHDIRHSAASLLYGLEVDAKVAQLILGHARLSTTLEIDTKFDKNKTLLRKAIAKMDRALGGGRA